MVKVIAPPGSTLVSHPELHLFPPLGMSFLEGEISDTQPHKRAQTRNHTDTLSWVLDGFGSTERRLQRLAKVVHPGPNTSGWLAGPLGSGEKEGNNTDKFSKPMSNSDAKMLSLFCKPQK